MVLSFSALRYLLQYLSLILDITVLRRVHRKSRHHVRTAFLRCLLKSLPISPQLFGIAPARFRTCRRGS